MLRTLFPRSPGKFTWRMLATTLGGQAICIFFGALVARGITATGPDADRAGTYLLVGCALAVLSFVAAGRVRKPGGIVLGWLIQLVTLASAVIVPFMLVIGVIFTALWVVCLVQGARIDAEQAARAESASQSASGSASEA